MRSDIFLLFGAMCLLAIGCGEDDDDIVAPETVIPPGAVRGTVALTGDAADSGAAVTGRISIFHGNDSVIVSVDREVQADHVLAEEEYEFVDIEPQLTYVFYQAHLTVGGQPRQSSGYATVQVEPGDTAVVEQPLYLPVSYGPATGIDGPVEITGFSLGNFGDVTRTVAHVEVVGALANMNSDVVFIHSADNVVPFYLQPAPNNAHTFSALVPLKPGRNYMCLTATNSTGEMVVSDSVATTYLPNGETMLGTLVWDTPANDIDLHLWYYPKYDSTLDLTETATEHCAHWNRDIVTIPPDGKVPHGNLDISDVDGQAIEHITLVSYPDGYYVFALNSFELEEGGAANCTFTLSAPGVQRSEHHRFATANAEAYEDDERFAWARCFDVRVVGGAVTVIDPDPAFVYRREARNSAAKSVSGKTVVKSK